MLIPASPRIAASFASSPGRSGTSMSIWIISPREGHGSARLQALRAVAWLQIAYGMRSPHSSEFMRFTLAYVGIQVRDLERSISFYRYFFFQAEDGIRDLTVTGVQTCALPI